MSIFLLRFLGAAAGIASMTAAVERNDLDEAARQGAMAGPAVVEQALRSKVRETVLAGIIAAPATEDRAELLVALAKVAGGGDRRTAIPAARAARTIAEQLANKELPDDIAGDDVQAWRDAYEQLALARGRVIEVRVAALETAAALGHVGDPAALGFDLAKVMADPDPALRAAALDLIPRPTAKAMYAVIVPALGDGNSEVAFAAAEALCIDAADDPAAVKAALGETGAAQVKAIAKTHPSARDLARCAR
jgi:HEAT repeat protein